MVTLGSPISGDPHHSSASALFAAINGDPTLDDQTRYVGLSDAPPVPTTSIYSETDGIVAWEGSVQKESPTTENIEVPASHLGIGVNPFVMLALADRLAQRKGGWKPFKRSGLLGLFYRSPGRQSRRVSRETRAII